MITSAPPAHAARHRVAAGDAFAEHRQVGLDAEVALRAAQSQTEAGHDFVEDQQRAELIAQFADFLIEVKRNRTCAAFRSERFDDHGGGSAPQPVEDQMSFQRAQAVREEFFRAGAGATRNTLRFQAACARDVQAVDHLVAPAVIRAADFDHIFLFGECARGADGRHDAFGARAQHAEHFHGGHEAVDEFRQLQFIFMEQAGDRTAGCSISKTFSRTAHNCCPARWVRQPAENRYSGFRRHPTGTRLRLFRWRSGRDS